jgi:hypothetical protein
MRTDNRYLTIVLSELFANVLRHGVDLVTKPPMLEFTTEQYSTSWIIWLRMENNITKIPEELKILKARMASADGKIGMSVLLYAAAAWGLPEPRFGLQNTEPETFISEVPLGLAGTRAAAASAS